MVEVYSKVKATAAREVTAANVFRGHDCGYDKAISCKKPKNAVNCFQRSY
jgi:hypothetical protein